MQKLNSLFSLRFNVTIVHIAQTYSILQFEVCGKRGRVKRDIPVL